MTPPPEPPHPRLRCSGRQEDEGGGRGTDQNSPSSFRCSSCLWTSGATSSHSLALEQRQVGEQSSFPPGAALTPELLESPGQMETLSVARPCSARVGPEVCSAPPRRVLAGHLLVTPGSIPLNPAPGIPDSDQRFCPALVGDLGGLWAEVRGVGSAKFFSRRSGWGCRGQTHVLEAGH